MKAVAKLKDEARKHEQREEWENAIDDYLQVLNSMEAGDGDLDLPLYNRVGDLFVRLGKPADAVIYYERAADQYAEVGLYNNAIALCNKALRYVPDRLELIRKLGQFSGAQGFLTDSRRWYLEYAERQLKAGALDDAFNALEDFATVHEDADIRELLGRQLKSHNRIPQAVSALKRAYSLRQQAGQPDLADKLRAEVLELDPDAFVGDSETAAIAVAEPAPVDVHEPLELETWEPPEVEVPTEELPSAGDLGLESVTAFGDVAPEDTDSLRLPGLETFGGMEEETADSGFDTLPDIGLDVSPLDIASAPETMDELPLLDTEDLGLEGDIGGELPMLDMEAGELPPLEIESFAGDAFGGEPPAIDDISGGDLPLLTTEEDLDTQELELEDHVELPTLETSGDLEISDFEAETIETFDISGQTFEPLPTEPVEEETIETVDAPVDEFFEPVSPQLFEEPAVEVIEVSPPEPEPEPEPVSEAPHETIEPIREEASEFARFDVVETAATVEPYEPIVHEPVPELEPAEPEPVEPQVAEPQVVEPQVVEPQPVEPQPVEPQPVEPQPVEPLRAEPVFEFEPEPEEPVVAETRFDPAAELSRADELVARGDRFGAIQHLVSLHPRLAAEGFQREAWEAATALLQLDPTQAGLLQQRVEYAAANQDDALLVQSYLEFGRHLVATGAATRAKAIFQSVLDIDPNNAEARKNVHIPTPPPSTGYIDLMALISEDDEKDDSTRFVVAEKAPTGDEERDFADMLSQFKQKVAEHVSIGEASAHYDLGLAFKEMGLIDEAISEFQTALKGGEERLKVYEELGQCFLLKQQYNVAVNVLNRALQMPVRDVSDLIGVFYALGRSHEELGHRDEARSAYERVVGLDINFQDASRRLASL